MARTELNLLLMATHSRKEILTMNIKLVSDVLTLLAMLYGSLGVPSPAQSQEVFSAGKYEQFIPENSRSLITRETFDKVAASPCNASLSFLINQYITDPNVPSALRAVLRGLQELPVGYPIRIGEIPGGHPTAMPC